MTHKLRAKILLLHYHYFSQHCTHFVARVPLCRNTHVYTQEQPTHCTHDTCACTWHSCAQHVNKHNMYNHTTCTTDEIHSIQHIDNRYSLHVEHRYIHTETAHMHTTFTHSTWNAHMYTCRQHTHTTCTMHQSDFLLAQSSESQWRVLHPGSCPQGIRLPGSEAGAGGQL